MRFDFTDKKNIGKDYDGFVLLAVDELPDYKTRAVYLRHRRTGLEVYHILAEDKENTFAFAFRTFAKNSKGAAHIMEHSTLCGSEKYPLKEPFTTLAATSLNTFLNAMTYPDKTVYPGASVVRPDYFNMMDVYADAVFFPRLDHATFLQEGHRLELDDAGNLSIQGVVYNEMKGAYGAFMQVAVDQQISAMFPDSFAAFDSGGDPLEIPNLTYEEFLAFHQKFYSPDNCLLYLYGDIPTGDQLDFLNERFMERIAQKYNCTADIPDAASPLPLVKKEIRELQQLKLIDESKEIRVLAPETGSTGEIVALSWYSGMADMEKLFLSEVLCGNDSSPLSYRLKGSGLGDDLSPIWNNFGQMQEEFFCYGLSGVKKSDEKKVCDLVRTSLREIYEEGISQSDIDSAVMGIDFSLREVTRYGGPYSLVLMGKVLKGWNYGKPCCDQLSPITSFEKVKEQLRADKEFTRKLIKKYFLNQKVEVTFIAEPSADYFKIREKAERDVISRLEKTLDKTQLKKDLDELHAYQQHIETAEETACMPRTKLSALNAGDVEVVRTDLQFVEGADGAKIPLFVNEESTNGIFYVDVLFPFDRLEPEYYQYVPFLSNVLTNMGWNGKKWDECIAESACVMGDVWGRTCYGVIAPVPDCERFAQAYKEYDFIGRKWLGISCKALTERAEDSLKLLSEIITTMSFDDKKRFATLAGELKAEKKAMVVENGADYSMKRAVATMSASQALNEIMWGISQLQTVRGYTAKNAAEMLKKFEYIYTQSLKSGGILHITADGDSLKKILPLLQGFAKSARLTKLLPARNTGLADLLPFVYQYKQADGDKNAQVLNVDTQTGYAALATKASPYLTKEAAAESVFGTWFQLHSLWDKIRTTGGAYGAGSWPDNMTQTFLMYSYRDPQPGKTPQVCIDALKEITGHPVSADDVEQTIVSCYGNAIIPACPKDRGARAFEGFLSANPSEFKRLRVQKLFAVTAEDVASAAERLLLSTEEVCRTVVFCDKSKKITGNLIKIPL